MNSTSDTSKHETWHAMLIRHKQEKLALAERQFSERAAWSAANRAERRAIEAARDARRQSRRFRHAADAVASLTQGRLRAADRYTAADVAAALRMAGFPPGETPEQTLALADHLETGIVDHVETCFQNAGRRSLDDPRP